MHWGKSLNQCLSTFCSSQNNNTFQRCQVKQQPKNISGLRKVNPNSELKEILSTNRDSNEKRSLKKYVGISKSPRTSFQRLKIDASSQNSQLKQTLPQQYTVRKVTQQQFFRKKVCNDIQGKMQNQVQKQFITKQAKKYAIHQIQYQKKEFQEGTHFKPQNPPNFHNIKNQFFVEKEKENKVKSPQILTFDQNKTSRNKHKFPVDVQYQQYKRSYGFYSPSSFYQPNQGHTIRFQNFQHQTSLVSSNKQDFQRNFNSHIQNSQNLNLISFQNPLNQCPTIRQQNQTYEQSRSLNHSKEKSYTNELHDKDLVILQRKRQVIDETLEGQVDHEKSEVIERKQNMYKGFDEEGSQIEGNTFDPQNFQLSCEELLLQSQPNIVPQAEKRFRQAKSIEQNSKQSSTEQKPQTTNHHTPNQQSICEPITPRNPQSHFNCYRRPLHQPSICIKIIQNKLRGHAYQLSHSSSNQPTSSYKKTMYESQYQSQYSNQELKQVISPRTMNSPVYAQIHPGQNKVETREEENTSKPKRSRVVFRLEEPVGILSQNNTQRANEKSLIGLLAQQDKQNSPYKQLESHRSPQKSDKKIPSLHNMLSHNLHKNSSSPVPKRCSQMPGSLFKQITNQQQLHSDNELTRRNSFNQKKVKTLINRKVTINSILQESSSIMKNTSQKQSNTIMSKYLSDDLIDGMLSSRGILNRQESTVIARYCFNRQETLNKIK